MTCTGSYVCSPPGLIRATVTLWAGSSNPVNIGGTFAFSKSGCMGSFQLLGQCWGSTFTLDNVRTMSNSCGYPSISLRGSGRFEYTDEWFRYTGYVWGSGCDGFSLICEPNAPLARASSTPEYAPPPSDYAPPPGGYGGYGGYDWVANAVEDQMHLAKELSTPRPPASRALSAHLPAALTSAELAAWTASMQAVLEGQDGSGMCLQLHMCALSSCLFSWRIHPVGAVLCHTGVCRTCMHVHGWLESKSRTGIPSLELVGLIWLCISQALRWPANSCPAGHCSWSHTYGAACKLILCLHAELYGWQQEPEYDLVASVNEQEYESYALGSKPALQTAPASEVRYADTPVA